MTAFQFADAAEHDGYEAANLQFSKLGHQIAEALERRVAGRREGQGVAPTPALIKRRGRSSGVRG